MLFLHFGKGYDSFSYCIFGNSGPSLWKVSLYQRKGLKVYKRGFHPQNGPIEKTTYSCHVFNKFYDYFCYLRRSGAFHPPVALPSTNVAENEGKGRKLSSWKKMSKSDRNCPQRRPALSQLTWSWRSWVVWQWWHLSQRPCRQCQRWLCLWLSAAQWELLQCSPRTCQECRVCSSHPFLWSEWCHWCLLVVEPSLRWCWQVALVWPLGGRV